MASSSGNNDPKGRTIEEFTFKKYKFEGNQHIGHKSVEVEGKDFVNFVWCKLCAKHKNVIISIPSIKGNAKKSVLTYMNGTNVVNKFNLERHIGGEGHRLALGAENALPKNLQTPENFPVGANRLVQPRIDLTIDLTIDKNSSIVYEKMIRTAYNLALHPTLLLKTFKLLVKCQRENGVALVSGKDDHRAASEYMKAIVEAIKEKVAVIMRSTHFFNLLSDGSQARKTGSEKELVLIRVERGGIPTYIYLSLLEMSNFGGTDAESLKTGIDSIFAQDGFPPLDETTDYTKKFVGATADGASVNFGHISGLLTRLEVSRPWLLKIHCSNHRTELSVGDVFDNKSPFSVVDETYKGIFYLHRDFMTHDRDILRIVNAHAHDANKHIINRLRERFSDFFDNQSLYQSMDFIDPENWDDDNSNYGREAIQHIVDHFEIPLLHAKFENKFVLKEWKKLRELVKIKYWKFVNIVPLLWKKIFVFRRSEFPNVCLLAKLIFSISSSNSAVERCFNILTQILSDTRLSMKHDTVNMLMIIKCHNMIWSEEERNDLIKRATEIYMKKTRKKIINYPQEKKAKETEDDAGQSQCNKDAHGSSSSDEYSSEEYSSDEQ